MFCNKCGNKIEFGTKYCNKCGNYLGEYTNVFNSSTISPIKNANLNINNQNKKKNNMFLSIGVGIIIVLSTILLLNTPNSNYYFDINSHENNNETSNDSVKKERYKSVIVTDNVYSGLTINNQTDAYKIIKKDSVSQKSKCPAEIKIIEDEIINKYDIPAVNLCEIDVEFAKEIEKVIDFVYKEYPIARGNITNLTLENQSPAPGTIAAFSPTFIFVEADSKSVYSNVIKTQIFLYSPYFLNKEQLEYVVKNSSQSGHFPPNASSNSPLAHEFGHYLSFIAMLKNYQKKSILLVKNIETELSDILYDFMGGNFSLTMIKEAYNDYKKDTHTTLSLDEWRKTISNYAMAKNEKGEYIYDETIAESFHDVYLNGDNAKDASKYIIKVLKKKLGEI